MLGFKKSAQLLARPVPVDEKNQPRAEVIEISEKLLVISGVKRTGRHKKWRPARQCRNLIAVRIRPDHRETLEERAKELQSPQMHVAVGETHGSPLHMDDNHMRIRGADVVLKYQPGSGPGCGRAEA